MELKDVIELRDYIDGRREDLLNMWNSRVATTAREHYSRIGDAYVGLGQARDALSTFIREEKRYDK
jgi:hypothetical protein